MPVALKSAAEIDRMRAAGAAVAACHDAVRAILKPGVTTRELDDAVWRAMRQRGGSPLFLSFPNADGDGPPFPAVTCISVQDEVVHGIPSDRPLKAGELVSVDVGVRLNGWCGDSGWTYAVGEPSPEHARLMDCGRESLAFALRELPRRKRWSEIAGPLAEIAAAAGFGVVKEFSGHGLGRTMHEEPEVPNYADDLRSNWDFDLVPGLTLAIEPMLTAGSPEVSVSDDDWWTVTTDDGSAAVHFEHTVALTERGVEILTAGVGESLPL
ncbi:type I methionyl aminopeptidase [Alienimonas sp. DA493]|uniref:type I methionyl aminopeptidase n=1 Tax=Alienimonas sp. DA493 TaxID=3373605 RepID=UPI003754C9F4